MQNAQNKSRKWFTVSWRSIHDRQTDKVHIEITRKGLAHARPNYCSLWWQGGQYWKHAHHGMLVAVQMQQYEVSVCVEKWRSLCDYPLCFHTAWLPFDLSSLWHMQLCQDCVGSLDPAHSSACVSLDCPVYHCLHRAKQELASIDPLREQLQNTLKHERTLW